MEKTYKDAAKSGLSARLPEIETFENQFKNYKITISIPEFTSLCPKTGNPDFGSIIIEYQPDKRTIELKSLKTYIQSYRNLPIFYENSINLILRDILKACKPVWVKVKGEFKPRGGISSVIEACYPPKINESH
ncbi:MAG: preQ(1) synthase [Candidatus Omnitrophica bacterium]|nr:preQ(1) synthase [Candidatus Omnitrophota bacterium]